MPSFKIIFELNFKITGVFKNQNKKFDSCINYNYYLKTKLPF